MCHDVLVLSRIEIGVPKIQKYKAIVQDNKEEKKGKIEKEKIKNKMKKTLILNQIYNVPTIFCFYL